MAMYLTSAQSGGAVRVESQDGVWCSCQLGVAVWCNQQCSRSMYGAVNEESLYGAVSDESQYGGWFRGISRPPPSPLHHHIPVV